VSGRRGFQKRRSSGGGEWIVKSSARGGVRKGVFSKMSRGWRAVICKMPPPLSVAFGSRSCVPDRSLHSLHECVGLHLIRSQ
jgi:hypothetical protein